MKSWDMFWTYWSLWTSLVVAMHDDIENTSVGTDHVITVIYSYISVNCITDRGKAGMMLHTSIGAGHRNANQLILIMDSPNVT